MRALDLFSGIGGWTLGLHRAGIETVAACEIDEWKRAQYARLYPEVKLYDDVEKLSGARLVRECGPIDFVVGSPPCKHISSARTTGERKGVEGDGLFFEAIRIVDEVRPAWFAFENSPHLRTRGADAVLSELERANYACWPFVVGACHTGAAHKRQRVWLVGCDAAREPGWSSRQSREPGWLGAYADKVAERSRTLHDKQMAELQSVSAGGDVKGKTFPGADRFRLGPIGAASLSSHLREYDGLPSRDAERARAAYGDAIVPQIATAIGNAILKVSHEAKAMSAHSGKREEEREKWD